MNSIIIVYSSNPCGLESISINAENDRMEEKGREILKRILKAKCSMCNGIIKRGSV